MPQVNEHDLLLIGARVRLAEIEAEAAALRQLLNVSAAPAPPAKSSVEPVSEAADSGGPPRRLHWRLDPANAEKAAAASRKQWASMRRRRALARREARR